MSHDFDGNPGRFKVLDKKKNCCCLCFFPVQVFHRQFSCLLIIYEFFLDENTNCGTENESRSLINHLRKIIVF